MLDQLKKEVLEANLSLAKNGLVVLTWGNASGIDREKNLIVIKPSGVPYEKMTIEDLVVVDMEGKVKEGRLKPSVDLPTHIELYKRFKEIKGVVHTHSSYATSFAQAKRPIECYGTTQADTFYGAIPLVRELTQEEITAEYEKNTGVVIAESLGERHLDKPGCLVSSHGVFSWGASPRKAAENALIIESCAKMAFQTLLINPEAKPIPEYLAKEHYERKHGNNARYGQGEEQ